MTLSKDVIFISIILLILYWKFLKQVMNYIIQYKFLLFISSFLYLIILFFFNKIIMQDAFIAISYMLSYGIFLTSLLENYYKSQGVYLRGWGISGQPFRYFDSIYLLIGVIPFLGTIPLTIRLYFLLGSKIEPHPDDIKRQD